MAFAASQKPLQGVRPSLGSQDAERAAKPVYGPPGLLSGLAWVAT